MSRNQTGIVRQLVALMTPLILLAVSVDSALEAWDSVLSLRSFPELGSFERPREVGNWLPHQSVMVRSNEWSTDGDYSLKVDLRPSKYPGVALLRPESDWSEYRLLEFDLHNSGDQKLPLVVKIHDEENERNGLGYHDRFHQEFVLESASTSNVVIDLAKVKAAPADRQMDMTEINMLDIFSANLAEPATFFIDNVRLKK